jgi:hypothetical protein
MIYHYQIGFPKDFQFPTAKRSLRYTYHARIKAMTIGAIDLPSVINPSSGKLIELNLTGRFPQYVYRLQYSNTKDLVMVLSAKTPLHWTVVTVWLNNTTDSHKSLDCTRYAIPNS